jgi:hypothetical protein
MAWERRGDGHYYYQSERDKTGKVHKRYVGTGDIAETIAHADEAIRRHREEQRARAREELEHMRNLAAPGLELHEAVDTLVAAHLVAAKFHRHRGEWRRERSQRSA